MPALAIRKGKIRENWYVVVSGCSDDVVVVYQLLTYPRVKNVFSTNG